MPRSRSIPVLCILFLAGFILPAKAQIKINGAPCPGPIHETGGKTLKSLAAIREDSLFGDYDIQFYKLDVEVNDRSDHIQGNATVLARVRNNPLSDFVLELYSGLQVDKVLVNEQEQPFIRQGDELWIQLDPPVDVDEMVNAQIFYGGQTGGGMVREIDKNWGVPVTSTLSEPFYAKDWFPCKQSLEDKADSVHVFITTDYPLKGVSNGILTGTTYFPNGKVRYEWKSRYPIAFYLISIAVAEYMEYDIEAHPAGLTSPIFIQNFLYDRPGCLETYRDQINVAVPIMELYCDRFGPYPFREEKYGHYMWPWGGGMEHQTMTGMGNFEFYLVAHEMGHSWFGDYVTCASWQDIWINEGFATFAGYLATENLGPEYADGERLYRFESAMEIPDGSVYIPAAEANDDSRIFSSSLSYNKGMALLYMIRYELQDDELFFQSLRDYVARYANGVATGMDFKEVLEETTGVDFTDFFNQWYFGAGYPIYQLTWEQQEKTMTLHSTQTTSSKLTPLFRMPMEYRLFYSGGDTTVRVYQAANEETYEFTINKTIIGIEVDPDNRVLNGLAGIQHITGKKSNGEFVTVYPNPAEGHLNFMLSGNQGDAWMTGSPEDPFTDRSGDLSAGRAYNPGKEQGTDLAVEIWNEMGQRLIVKRFEGCVPWSSYSLDLGELSQGIYFVRFSGNGASVVKKILVK